MIKVIVDAKRDTEREMEFLDIVGLEEEIKNIPKVLVSDDEDYPFSEAWEYIDKIANRLPDVWKHDVEWPEIEIATNGEEILFKYDRDCERIADLLDTYVFGSRECHTGYYDPVEDERDDCVDANTGWHYINWD